MATAEVEAVLKTIHELSCGMLRQSFEEGTVTVVDPDKEIPSGQEILSQLPPQKAPIWEHVITLFNSLSTTTDPLSSTFANLFIIGKDLQ